MRAAVAEHRALAVTSGLMLQAVGPRQTAPVMSVSFYGSLHPVLTHEGKPYVAMKSVVDALGLQWEAQLKRIVRRTVVRQSCATSPGVAGDLDRVGAGLPGDCRGR